MWYPDGSQMLCLLGRTELLVNHEFNLRATQRSEGLIRDMIEYIGQHENPVTIPTDIEEADVRIIPHALHVVNCGATRIVLLSNGTDVMVLA
jgi:hypothetical protein